ncbi:MAG: response regulator [Alphaproteobacteria bacterium]|nr:response regulator [Alphaproteobacteria bacterium]
MSNTKNTAPSAAEPDRKPHILVVDDDERLRQLLSRFLVESGFLVSTATDAREARGILNHLAYDLIILDVMMPGEDGMSLTRSLKGEGFLTPILLLTALGETEQRISGLEAGADDYLPKPFEPRELLLRINAILRRMAVRPPEKQAAEIKFGKWVLDQDRGELVDGRNRVPLTAVESTLVRALASRKGEVISREELAALCDLNASERTIDVQVTRLRKKVEEDPKMPRYIQTVRGKGYVLWSD